MFGSKPNAVVTKGQAADAAYLNTLRTTIATLDGHRLTAMNAAITLLGALALAGITINHYLITDFHDNDSGKIIASAFTVIAIAVSAFFCIKIWMFNFFIGKAVESALEAESRMGLPSECLLTAKFEEHPFAGNRRGLLALFFKWLYIGVVLFAGVGLGYTMWHIVGKVPLIKDPNQPNIACAQLAPALKASPSIIPAGSAKPREPVRLYQQ